MSRRVSIADVVVDVPVPDDDFAWAVDAMFAACPSATGSPAINIELSTSPFAVPDRRPDSVINEVERWYSADGVVTRHASGATGKRRDADVVVWLPPAASNSDRAFRLAVQYPLVDALSLHGRYPIHAAALTKGDTAILAAGPTGAGKSTFAAAALQSGWRALGDDLAFVGLRADGEIRVWALPKPMNVPGDVMTRVPPDAQRIDDDARARWTLPPAGRLTAGSARLAGIVLVRHSDGDASSRRLGASPELLKQLAVSLGIGRLSGDAVDVFRLAAAMARLQVHEYCHDRNSRQRDAAVKEFLSSIAPSLSVHAATGGSTDDRIEPGAQ